MFGSQIAYFGLQVASGTSTLLEPEEVRSLLDDPLPLRFEWANFDYLRRLFLHSYKYPALPSLMPKLLPPASPLSLFEQLQQGLIGTRSLNDRGSIRETEVVVAELLRRYGYKNRLTRRSKDAGVDICAVKASPYVPNGYVKSIWQVANYQRGVPVDKVNELPATLLRCKKVDWMVLVALPRLTRQGATAAFPIFVATRKEVLEQLNKGLELIEEDNFMKYVNLAPPDFTYDESEADRQALLDLVESLYPPNVHWSKKIFNYFQDAPLE